MIRSITEKTAAIEIDLTGPNGNCFVLIATAKSMARQLGLDADRIVKEMQACDYEHLLGVFEREFGQYVVIYR